VLPKTLAVNAAQDATELVAKLRAFHHAAQTQPGRARLAEYGLDLAAGRVRDNVEAGVLEPAVSKTKMIQVRVFGWGWWGGLGWGWVVVMAAG
jgi:T-complex protein 1 subunit alpha